MTTRVLAFALVIGMAGVAAPGVAQENGDRGLVIRRLDFEGNRHIDDYTLRVSIATSRSSVWERYAWLRWTPFGSRRYFDEMEFRRDVLRIHALYRRSGFFEVLVDTVVARTADAVDIRVLIHEGFPVRVDSIGVTGTEGIVPPRQLLRELPLRVGEPFDRLLFLTAADSIRRTLRGRGHLFADVFRNYEEDRRDRSARVWYEVVPGPVAVIDSIAVVGTDQIDESLVRSILAVRPGDRYAPAALLASQLELYRLGVFDYVDVAVADSVWERPEDSLVTVRVQVNEGPLGRVRVGVGYGRIDCYRTLSSWTVGNFLGGGRTFDASVRLAKIGTGMGAGIGCLQDDFDPDTRDVLNFTATTGVRFPLAFAARTDATLSLLAERRSEFNAYLRESVGANLSVTQHTRANIPVTVSYSVSLGSTRAEPANFCAFLNVCRPEDTEIFLDQRLQNTLGLLVVRDRSNSVTNPTRGTRASVNIRGASVTNPGVRFVQANADLASYHPIGRRSVFAWHVRFGAILAAGASFDSVPTEERFYSGGATSVRGFRQNGLGPVVYVTPDEGVLVDSVVQEGYVANELTEVDASPVGGDRVLAVNAELRFPFPAFQRFEGSLFVDAGQVLAPTGSLSDLGAVRVTPGVGLRVLTPIGPLRLDVAYNLYDPEVGRLYLRRDPELILVQERYRPTSRTGLRPRIVFNLSVGQAF